MKKRGVIAILFLLCFASLYAKEQDSLDSIQQNISTKFVHIASSLDTLLSNSYVNNNSKYQFFDVFFQNEKFINESDKSYISVRFGTTLQSRTSPSQDVGINAYIALTKTQRKFNLFMHSIGEKQIFANSMQTPQDQNNKKQEFGISYLAKVYHHIDSKYSLGIRRLNPFVRARYYKIFQVGSWKIEPLEQIELSIKDKFQEQTNLFFDRPLTKKSLFRTTLQREISSKLPGMNYSMSLGYFYTFSQKRALNLTQLFLGNTKESSINQYITSLDYREYFWKKWLVYDIEPALSYDKVYNYRPNYILNINFYIYFQKEKNE